MALAHNDCQSKCDWRPTGERYRDQPLFRCTGCKSEWAPTEKWTPKNVDGQIALEVAAARAACPA